MLNTSDSPWLTTVRPFCFTMVHSCSTFSGNNNGQWTQHTNQTFLFSNFKNILCIAEKSLLLINYDIYHSSWRLQFSLIHIFKITILCLFETVAFPNTTPPSPVPPVPRPRVNNCVLFSPVWNLQWSTICSVGELWSSSRGSEVITGSTDRYTLHRVVSVGWTWRRVGKKLSDWTTLDITF